MARQLFTHRPISAQLLGRRACITGVNSLERDMIATVNFQRERGFVVDVVATFAVQLVWLPFIVVERRRRLIRKRISTWSSWRSVLDS